MCCNRFQYHKYSHHIMFTKSGTCCGCTLCHFPYLWVLRPFQAHTAYVEPIVKLSFAKPELLGKPHDLPYAEFSFLKCAAGDSVSRTIFFIHSRLRHGKNMSQNTNFLLFEQYLIKAFVFRPSNESNIL